MSKTLEVIATQTGSTKRMERIQFGEPGNGQPSGSVYIPKGEPIPEQIIITVKKG